MARFFGKIGFKKTVEKRKGVFEEQIIDRDYRGDYMRNTSSNNAQTNGDSINDNITVSNQISIVADPFLYENFYAIKYIEVFGQKWKVSSVEVQRPRLIIVTGGLYNEESN